MCLANIANSLHPMELTAEYSEEHEVFNSEQQFDVKTQQVYSK